MAAKPLICADETTRNIHEEDERRGPNQCRRRRWIPRFVGANKESKQKGLKMDDLIFDLEDDYHESWWRIDPNQRWRHMLKKTKHV